MKIGNTLLLVSCLAGVAHADNGFYMVGSVGQSRFRGDDGDILKQIRPSGVTMTSSSFDKDDTGYKVQIGYQFASTLAIEGGYIDFGEMRSKVRGVNSGFIFVQNKSYESTGWNLNLVNTLPLGEQFSLLFKFGVIQAKVEAKTYAALSNGNSISERKSSTDIRPLFGLGANYNYNEHIGARLEWERFTKIGSQSETLLEGDMDMFSAGLIYKF